MNTEDSVLKKVAVRIKELRNDMTQKEFAKMLGVSAQAVSEWENANKMPRMGIIEKLSIKYRVPKSYILGEDALNIDKNWEKTVYAPNINKETGKYSEHMPREKYERLIRYLEQIPEERLQEAESYLQFLANKNNSED